MDEAMKTMRTRYCPAVECSIARYFDAKIACEKNAFIRECLPLLKEYCLRPGKRIRPLLVLSAFEGYSARSAVEGMIDIAAAAEIMHAAFLVHDDIIDRAETRRGLPTLDRVLQRKLGSARTPLAGHDEGIVFGDLLIYASMELTGSADIDPALKVSVMNETLDIYRRTAWGQALDIVCSKPEQVRADDVNPAAVSEMKTAYYTIAGPLRTGLRLSGKFTEEEGQRITRASLPLGIAFQLRDDLLGVFADEQAIGKSPDSDLAEGKYTLLVQKAVSMMSGSDAGRFNALFSGEAPSASDVAEMRSLIEKSGAKDFCAEEVGRMVSDARMKIDELSIRGEGKEFLCGLCSLIGDISAIGIPGRR